MTIGERARPLSLRLPPRAAFSQCSVFAVFAVAVCVLDRFLCFFACIFCQIFATFDWWDQVQRSPFDCWIRGFGFYAFFVACICKQWSWFHLKGGAVASENVGHLGRGRCCDCDGVHIEEVSSWSLLWLLKKYSEFLCCARFIIWNFSCYGRRRLQEPGRGRRMQETWEVEEEDCSKNEIFSAVLGGMSETFAIWAAARLLHHYTCHFIFWHASLATSMQVGPALASLAPC